MKKVPPPWPTRRKALEADPDLVNFVEREFGVLAAEDADAFWRDQLAPDRRLTLEEQTLMKADFEERPQKQWRRITAHLSSGTGSQRFLELVSAMIENGGFISNATMHDHGTAANLIQARAFYDAIGGILRRYYPDIAASGKGQSVDKMTVKLCKALWNCAPKVPGAAGNAEWADVYKRTSKRFREPKDMALRAVTHAVYFGPTK